MVDMKYLAGVPPRDSMAVLLISVIFTARVLTTNIWVTLLCDAVRDIRTPSL